jgi:hypothetical protein
VLLPGYALALTLTFFAPKVFTAIAFDSGGVASGPMTATFLLAFAMGACNAVGGDLLTDAFGVVAMVAMTPLITIQVLGVIYKLKLKETEEEEEEALDMDLEEEEEYIELESEDLETEAAVTKEAAYHGETLEELLEKDNYYIDLEF